eukprot:CAMPEP_0201483386 /NCGR_PEP_ID=MMETSP0151_2-20130828/7597_1 /ASSEMBLY_ACC=CAM_ASM_000257 /TAXON_ID=200890 /ORGANISM="Paramoeba atlantica, Strain 621/1 / CCAP 1560/9" /LENGTH=139 /DNA_ID=CAMNT_0047866505 /DNA_START=63 /DNA_END=482 /DNA_ORIENTATION=-
MAAVQLLGAQKIIERGGNSDVVSAASSHVSAKENLLKEKRKMLWANKKKKEGTNQDHWSKSATNFDDPERRKKFLALMGASRGQDDSEQQQYSPSEQEPDVSEEIKEGMKQQQEEMFQQLEQQYVTGMRTTVSKSGLGR